VPQEFDGGIGSLLTQFVSRSSERRTVRAKGREELSSVEELRWAVVDEAKTQSDMPTSAQLGDGFTLPR
jgi:hypothetical protein